MLFLKVRELYAVAVSKNITTTQEYKECFQLLSFQSKEELSKKIVRVKELIVNNFEQSHLDHEVEGILVNEFDKFMTQLDNLELVEDKKEEVTQKDSLLELMNRLDLKEVTFV